MQVLLKYHHKEGHGYDRHARDAVQENIFGITDLFGVAARF
jgi:hypothetical protein